MTVYAHIENNEITGVYDLLPDNWRNISNFNALASDSELLQQLGWRFIVKDNPTFNPQTQRLGEPQYTIDNNVVYETIPVIDIDTQTIVETPNEPVTAPSENMELLLHEGAMTALRNKCKLLLQETDYTQLADVIELNGPELTQAYVTYRQQLRDLPNTYENDPSFTNEVDAQYPSLPGVE